VAKEASDIVLTDDNFASILNAVEEGRKLFDNIKRFVLHVLAENIAQATTLLVGLAFKDAAGNSVSLSPLYRFFGSSWRPQVCPTWVSAWRRLRPTSWIDPRTA
jgi:hypothetical protein